MAKFDNIDRQLLTLLQDDDRLPLSRGDLEALLEAGRANVGSALHQVAAFNGAVDEIVAKYPDDATYEPGSIL